MNWHEGGPNHRRCLRYEYRSRPARYLNSIVSSKRRGARERRQRFFVSIVVVMRLGIVILRNEIDLADAGYMVVRCMEKKKGTTYPGITDRGMEVKSVVAIAATAEALMVEVPISPGERAEVRDPGSILGIDAVIP